MSYLSVLSGHSVRTQPDKTAANLCLIFSKEYVYQWRWRLGSCGVRCTQVELAMKFFTELETVQGEQEGGWTVILYTTH
jgi:hypothetical protein